MESMATNRRLLGSCSRPLVYLIGPLHLVGFPARLPDCARPTLPDQLLPSSPGRAGYVGEARTGG